MVYANQKNTASDFEHLYAEDGSTKDIVRVPKADAKEALGITALETPAFTSGDALSPTAWTDVALLESGAEHATLFNRISTMFKNIRYLWKMLGSTDISDLGDGTVTGALTELNSNVIKGTYKKIQCANTGVLTCAGNTITERDVTFPEAFSSTPLIFLTALSGTTNVYHGNAMLLYNSATAAGFTIRVANAYSTEIAPSIRYLAIGD